MQACVIPGGRKVNYSYYPTGELKQQHGSDTYPQTYTYDATGRMKTLMTYKYFNTHLPTQGQAVTTWNYNAQRGFLTSKTYDDGKSVSYTYNYDGSLATRVWSRGITTSYAYDNAGALSGVTYSDSTPSVSYIRDRMGRPITITDASGIRSLAYNIDGSLATEGNVGYTYDALGRRISMSVTNGPATNYTYDAMSRLKTVSDGTRTATYTRLGGSNLLRATVINNGSSDVLTVNRTYDILDRLTNITSNGISYNYTYDNSDKRTKNILSDGSYWIYEYDDLGQITKGQKFTASGIAIWGQRFTFSYDNIGNFKDENRNGNVSKYTANSLNQYTQKTIPGRVSVSGYADANSKVTIKQLSTGTYAKPERHGMLYNKYFMFDNSVSPISEVFEVNAVKFDGTKDIVAKQMLNVFIPKTPELFTYDNDGNLLSDGKFTYTWDAENRLVKAESGSTRTEFIYDYMNRRTAKKNYLNNVLSSERKFTYDGWNMVTEYDGSNTLLNSYLWGEDLSGSLQGAGGVGGLLIVNDGSRVYYPVYDGNGNIMAYLNESGSKIVDYEYGTHGETLLLYGVKSDDFAFRFSTKYFDKETDLYYYGHRYLKPDINKWLTRDPIEEQGGNNLYAFVNNDAVNKWDYLGFKGGSTDSVTSSDSKNKETECNCITILVDNNNIDYRSAQAYLDYASTHLNHSVGHSWIKLQETPEKKARYYGHTGESGRDVEHSYFLSFKKLLFQGDPNPIRALWKTMDDGRMLNDKYQNGHTVKYAAKKCGLSAAEWENLTNYIRDYSKNSKYYSFTGNQCTTFAVNAGATAGLSMSLSDVQVSINIPTYVYADGKIPITKKNISVPILLREASASQYSVLTFATPDKMRTLLEKLVNNGEMEEVNE